MRDGPVVALVAVDLGRHGELIRRWLALPHVRQWWGDPITNLREIEALSSSQHALITHRAAPVGYVRWQRVSREDLEDVGIDDIPDGAVDIDIFIGEPAHLDLGIGTLALQLLLARLRADPTVPLAGMSTSIRNGRAIRAYEKAGFVRRQEYDDPEWGTCYVMEADLRSGPSVE